MNPEIEREKNKTLQVYAAMGITLICSFLPFAVAAGISILLFLCVLAAAYMLRKGRAEGNFLYNHMTYIIKTIWVSGVVALFSITAGSLFMLLRIDNTPLDQCIHGMGIVSPDTPVAELMVMFEPCLKNYMGANMQTLIVSAFLVVTPVLAYFILRFFRGVKLALNGQTIHNLKNWF